VEAARGLASSVLVIKSDESRLREAFRRVCARRPSHNELLVLLRMLSRAKKEFAENPTAATQFLAQGDSPVPDVNAVELASLASVCLSIYNLDEAMTRE
jgi:hypothetical protein